MVNVTQHLNFLGLRVRDRVTAAEGIVASVTFDLYGCVQAIVNPGVDKDGKPRESNWFDINRLEVLDNAPVMPRPIFEWAAPAVADGGHGPAERPSTFKA